MKLHELGILGRNACAEGHSVAVAGARMRGRCGKVRSTVPSRCENGVVCVHAMKRASFHVEAGDSDARAVVVHDEIEGKVFDKVVGIECERASVEGVEKRMAGAIGRACAPVRLSALSKFEALTAKRSLVDLSIFSSRKGESESLEL